MSSTLGFRIWHARYGLIRADSVIEDPLGFLKLAFFEVPFVPVGGLAVDVGIPSPRCFLADIEELPSYRDQLLGTVSGELKIGHVKVRFLRHDQVQLVAPVPKAPPCILRHDQYRDSIRQCALDFLSLQSCLSDTLQSLDAQAMQAEWASQLSPRHLTERVTRSTATFEEVEGAAPAARWANVLSARAHPNVLRDLSAFAHEL